MTNGNCMKTVLWSGEELSDVTHFTALLQYMVPRSEVQHNNPAGIMGHKRNSNRINEKCARAELMFSV